VKPARRPLPRQSVRTSVDADSCGGKSSTFGRTTRPDVPPARRRDGFNGVLAHIEACDVTMIWVLRAPIEKLLAYRERMGWSFNWASSHENDFNLDYGVSAREAMTHDPAVPLLEANELKP
jgi:Bacterial protein of unknown function (DUF899)